MKRQNFLVSFFCVLFILNYFDLIEASVEPQEPHFKDGKHNPKNHQEKISKPNGIEYCVIHSCRGCELDKLLELKNFLQYDSPFYEDVDVKYIHKAEPKAIFYDSETNVVEEVSLKMKSQKEINDMFNSKGFYKIEEEK